MKRFALLLAATAIATPALAADIITEEPPAPAPVEVAAYNWSGFYIGGQAGVGFGGSEGAVGGSRFPTNFGLLGGVDFADSDDTTFVGGGHIGYDAQVGTNFLVGVVADINYIDRDYNAGFVLPGVGFPGAVGTTTAFHDYKAELDYYGTVRGKLGVTYDRFAVYGTGGLAYGGLTDGLGVSTPFTSAAGTTYTLTDADTDKSNFGYAVGAGADYLVTQNLSVGLEYLYTDLGNAKSFSTFTGTGTGVALGFDPATFTTETKTDVDFHTVMAKVSYRFN